MTIERYYLGCPIWSNRDWTGSLFTDDARADDYLAQYAGVFNSVEGNSTFYGLPRPSTVQRWREQTGPAFRFCFKFPREITHRLQLRQAGAETDEFLKLMTPLGDRLGPLMLQLPPAFGPAGLTALKDYLIALPPDFEYAVEVRHRAFFDKGNNERALHRLLTERSIDRVMLDSRALFSAADDQPATLEAQRKKPRLPVHPRATGSRPLIRFIGHPDVEANRRFLQPWFAKLADWIGEGRTPYLFTHTPDNQAAPELAALAHRLLAEQVPDIGALARQPVAPAQSALF